MDPAVARLGEFGLIGPVRDRARQRSPSALLVKSDGWLAALTGGFDHFPSAP